jgi:hypothetical protein
VCSLRRAAEFDIRAVEGTVDSPDVELGDKTELTMLPSPKRSPEILTGTPEGLQAPTTKATKIAGTTTKKSTVGRPCASSSAAMT